MNKKTKTKKLKKIKDSKTFYEYLDYLINGSFKQQNEDLVKIAVRTKIFDKNGIRWIQKFTEDDHTDSNDCDCIVEYKFDNKIYNHQNYCSVLIQQIWNLREFYINKEKIRKVSVIVDKNWFALLPTIHLLPYLKDETIPYDNHSPSKAPKENQVLLEKLINDENIKPVYIKIDKDFSDADFLRVVRNLSIDIKEEYNIDDDIGLVKCYDYFQSLVIKDSTNSEETDIYVFLDLIRGKISVDREKEIVIYDKYDLRIDIKQFDILTKLFKYEESNNIDIISKKDIIIQEQRRRKEGAFYTPQIVIDYIHRINEELLGPDWYKRLPVYDRTSGPGNLMRGKKSSVVFQSSLHPEDIKEIKRIDPNAKAFVRDSYNHTYEDLKNQCYELYNLIIESEVFVDINNPPFGESSSVNQKKISTKGSSTNKLREEMIESNISGSKQQYIQMLYSLIEESKRSKRRMHIIMQFLNAKFFTKKPYHKFRNYMHQNGFVCVKILLFPSELFKGTSKGWIPAYAIWIRDLDKIEKDREFFSKWNQNKHIFKADILDIVNTKLEKIGEKELIGSDQDIWNWVKEKLKGRREIQVHRLTDAMNLYKNSQKEIKKTGNITEGYLGYMSDTKKTGDTKVFSSLYVVSGSTIIPENLIKAAVTFFITRHTKNDWINHADLDLVPDIDHPDYKIFSENCIIYMLFSSQASIRRNVYSEGKKREIIKNNFFPFSVDQIKKLAIKYEYEEMLQDIEDYGENRHLYYVIHDLLKNNSLWEESIDVLNMYKDLIEITFPYRKKMDRKYEAYCFDQGWYVIKKILEKYYPDLLINFEKIFNNMEDRLFSEMKKLIDDNI